MSAAKIRDIDMTDNSGRGGSKITEIRRLSGSRISIAKVPHDESGERMFTIVGTQESTERALMLLYSQVGHSCITQLTLARV